MISSPILKSLNNPPSNNPFNIDTTAASYFNPLEIGAAGGKPLSDANPYGAPKINASQPILMNGIYVDSKTYQPFSGNYNGESYKDGNKSGVQIPYSDKYINPNDAASRYQAVDVTKNAPVVKAADSLLTNFKSTPGITDFTDLLDASRLAKSTATTSFKNDLPAFDTSALETTLNNLNKNLAETTSGLDSRYSGLLDTQTGNENNIIARANALLPQYDQAASNIGDAQTRALQQQVSRYKLGTGTPASLGGGEEAMLANGVANIRLPLEQQRIQRQYDLLTGLELPIDQQQTQRRIGQLTGYTTPMVNQNYSNAYGTAQYLQSLKLQTAGMGLAEAQNYLRTMGLPDQMILAVLQGNQGLQSGDIGNLSGLNSLYSGSRYQGLQDLLGTNLSQPTASIFNPGGYPAAKPNQSRYPGQSDNPALYANGGVFAPSGVPTTPVGQLVDVGGGYQRDQQGNTWLNGNLVSQGQATLPAVQPTTSRYGQSPSGVQLNYADTADSGLINIGGGMYSSEDPRDENFYNQNGDRF